MKMLVYFYLKYKHYIDFFLWQSNLGLLSSQNLLPFYLEKIRYNLLKMQLENEY